MSKLDEFSFEFLIDADFLAWLRYKFCRRSRIPRFFFACTISKITKEKMCNENQSLFFAKHKNNVR